VALRELRDLMNYLSVCSGIEAVSVAWHPLGFTPLAFSEIEEFPSAVLKHHYPHVPNLGDMTNYREWEIEQPVDLLVGGTPCQSFSVAGLRTGLNDPRGNLALVYLGIADKFKPRWILWENVPGVLSSNRGRDFASFLGGLEELGYQWSYRTLDAQWFGVAQRRRRLFVVGHHRDWRGPAAVLLERHSLRRDPAPSRTQINENTPQPQKNPGNSDKEWPAEIVDTLTAEFASRYGYNRQHINGGATWFVPGLSEIAATLRTNRPGEGGLETDVTQIVPDVSPPITIGGRNNTPDKEAYVTAHTRVRRLTAIECERLQGFPDNYTQINYKGKERNSCPSAPRYKAIGNSMAVPVMNWLGRRIQIVDGILERN